MQISAYIPCFNNRATIAEAILGVREQSLPVAELFAVDDGSTDDSVAEVERAGVRVLKMERNSGRGPVRARAMLEAKHDLVLCCDATNRLAPDFLEHAAKWFDDAKVAAVYGRITQDNARNAVERWRGRHLFRDGQVQEVRHNSVLITYGTLIRKSHAVAVGNFRTDLRQGEDRELGERLRQNGLDVIYDPSLTLTSVARNSLGQVLERYWRWDAAEDPTAGRRGYLRRITYSIKVMAASDLRAGDPVSALISLLAPHYQLWKSFSHRS